MHWSLLSTAVSAVLALGVVLGSSPVAAQEDDRHGGRRAQLETIARDTWSFFDADTDPNTHLPLDNIGFPPGGVPTRGTYTSASNIGVYFWSVVAAEDMGLIDDDAAFTRVNATLTTVEHLSNWQGFLFAWYDTTTGHHIDHPAPGTTDLEGQSPTGQFISTVDNAWYASGLILVRQTFPSLADRATKLLNKMHFGIFYDTGDQSTSLTAGQMYGGFNANQGPANFHYGVLNTETRIAAYIGIGTHSMPGDVWWRTWRTMPEANFTWQEQVPQGHNQTYKDPQSGKSFTVFEGHYTYGETSFVPSWGGSMFEALMPSLVIPETQWGPRSFGLNDRRYPQAQFAYAQQTLHFPLWGLSPSSTPDDTGNYLAYGAHALATNGSPACGNCAYDETAVTPHASFLALETAPDEATSNIQRLRQVPTLYGQYGFFDAVDPRTNKVGHRYLVLDQSMIMAALDNVLADDAMHRHFAADPIIQGARPYLSMESFSLED